MGPKRGTEKAMQNGISRLCIMISSQETVSPESPRGPSQRLMTREQSSWAKRIPTVYRTIQFPKWVILVLLSRPMLATF